MKTPAQPQAASLVSLACGALSVPRKKRGSPPVAAATQREPVPLALDDRQAVVVRPHAADQQVVPVQDQVVDGERGADALLALDEGHAVGGGDMLEHDAEPGQRAPERRPARGR